MLSLPKRYFHEVLTHLLSHWKQKTRGTSGISPQFGRRIDVWRDLHRLFVDLMDVALSLEI